MSGINELMKPDHPSERRPPENIPLSNPAGGTPGPSAAAPPESPGEGIDFHSAEFNREDGLTDSAGNYRSFQTLDGIVTAHERHQAELRLTAIPPDPQENKPASPGKRESKTEAPGAGEFAAPLTVISEGRTLIIDTDPGRAIACAEVLQGHRMACAVGITGNVPPGLPPPHRGGIRPFHADRISVSGAFGAFSAGVTVGGREKPLAGCLEGADTFDLVLDLQPVPSYAGGRLPVGYYAPGPGSAALASAMAELPGMRGRFEKPRFVSFHQGRCFHGRSRVQDCRRCLEICPVGAIQSADRRISPNPVLCQGCGGCALVCPAEAFRLIQPSPEELLKSLRSTLERQSAGGAPAPSLMIGDSRPSTAGGLIRNEGRHHGPGIFFAVEEIAHVSLELLLSALAYGAGEVLVACDPQNPPPIGEAVEWQVRMARAVLRGLGGEEERVRFWVTPPAELDSPPASRRAASPGEPAGDSLAAPATSLPLRDRRTLVYSAAQVLQDRSGGRPLWLPLPGGAPFGAVAVDPSACTLCMACAAACPSGALSSGREAPRLVFQESECHQCGLCREVCPEDAIRLVPGLRPGHDAASTPTVIRESEPFRCVECGVPFAPPAMIDRMKQKLAGHRMYAGERQLRRLGMCRACRARDILTSREEGSWNP